MLDSKTNSNLKKVIQRLRRDPGPETIEQAREFYATEVFPHIQSIYRIADADPQPILDASSKVVVAVPGPDWSSSDEEFWMLDDHDEEDALFLAEELEDLVGFELSSTSKKSLMNLEAVYVDKLNEVRKLLGKKPIR